MKLKLIDCLVALQICISINLFAQDNNQGIEVSLGFGIQKQDRRLFEFPNADNIIQREESRYDNQYDLLFVIHVYNKNKFYITSGIGYSLINAKFSRPFDHNYFTGDGTEILRYIEYYLIHKLKLNASINYNLFTHNKSAIDLCFPININFIINKQIKGTLGEWKENKWKFEFGNTELYCGIRYQIGKFGFSISYRVLNFQKIDPVIFNSILFHSPNPEFLDKTIEHKNFSNILINFNYKL